MIFKKKIDFVEIFWDIIGIWFIYLFRAQNLFSIPYPKLLQFRALTFKLIKESKQKFMNILLSAGFRESSVGTDKITCINWAAIRILGVHLHHFDENSLKNVQNLIFSIVVENNFT